jgi:hypothetical protein
LLTPFFIFSLLLDEVWSPGSELDSSDSETEETEDCHKKRGSVEVLEGGEEGETVDSDHGEAYSAK